MKQPVLVGDIKSFVSIYDSSLIRSDARILITGATGLVGSVLAKCLLALRKDIHLVCPVRSLCKVESIFPNCNDNIEFVECNLVTFIDSLSANDKISYIIHCASPTNGKYIVENPVETYELAIDSTKALLKFAVRANVSSMVYVSSLEYYGQIFNDITVTEDMMGSIDRLSSRSSYPLGKQAAEYLCVAYALQYGVNVKIARLTQTFGAGVPENDNRVFAQFARSIINGEDIILHTEGKSAKPYCYTTDAISGILDILTKGEKGEAYNVANDETYISIRDLAEFLCTRFNPRVKVRVESHPEMGYAPLTTLRLSSKKLRALGWRPHYDLYTMFEHLINSFKENM